jgi:hypothetical protein
MLFLFISPPPITTKQHCGSAISILGFHLSGIIARHVKFGVQTGRTDIQIMYENIFLY